jgi:hypothetical protein
VTAERKLIPTWEDHTHVPYWYDVAEKGLIVLPVLIGSVLALRWWLRWRLWRRDDDFDLEERLELFDVAPSEAEVWERWDYRGKVRPLRSTTPDPTDELDVVRTVDATAASAGILQPVMMDQRWRRTNIVLIEQASAFDHLTHLFARAAHRLGQDGIAISLFSFNGDLNVLFPERGKPIPSEIW